MKKKIDDDAVLNQVWNGYCPESWFEGKKTRMRLNQWDFFESETTGLQIAVLPGIQAIIMNFRGEGKFRHTPTYADEIVNGEILSPQNTEGAPFNSPTTIFNNYAELKMYIKKVRRLYDPNKINSFLKPNLDGELLPGVE